MFAVPSFGVCRKNFQRILQKQGMKFKLNTMVTSKSILHSLCICILLGLFKFCFSLNLDHKLVFTSTFLQVLPGQKVESKSGKKIIKCL